ncbi:hypothetical protein ROP_19450 [Rhodococcus opacus B4]|uniref:Uncharacterized protein n=1 Tax=Rhodococcus opacus (strain B4) TaxID=632772 RepID=C1B0J2_RHOOB|nr:hypothetical protein ROP_19450 [Rhodococcus opacus B4]
MTTEAHPAEYAVEVRGVHKSFGALDVLQGVDLLVRKGEVTVILGRRVPASPHCCARSTTWRRSTGAPFASTATSSVTGAKATNCTNCVNARS